MIPRISALKPLDDFMLDVSFDDGFRVIYDVKDDMSLPGYDQLRSVAGLFEQVQLDQSRTVVYWNDEIDLPSDTIREYGQDWDPDFTKLTEAEALALQQAEDELARGETVPHEAIDWDADRL